MAYTPFSSFTGAKDFSANDFNRVTIGLMDPKSWEAMAVGGEVTNAETVNYRTQRPAPNGLHCPKIFGPVKDFECSCGKYKRLKHRGVVCEKCGVEVTSSKVRRERMGYIRLAAPVAHIWYLKSLPSRISMVLDIPLKDIERVLYFEAYAVIDPGMTPFERGQILSEQAYHDAVEEHGDDLAADMGGAAIRRLLQAVDVESDIVNIHSELGETSSETRHKKLVKRLKVLQSFKDSGNKPEWMVLEVLPVLPADLRPLVPLEGGRFATSDLNDLYRVVINRNNRLKRLKKEAAVVPQIIIRSEERMLQEAVDRLFDSGRRLGKATGSAKQVRSLTESIKGKGGRFRLNLLGKRVDYSGRSVIVVGPNLKLHQCGLPKRMALELFKPFVFAELLQLEEVPTIKSAKRMVEREEPVVWDILEAVIREHPVLLNRAPTLHRLGIQAFEPLLVEGKAIQIHPSVCAAFNADFDGDTMSVHVPLTVEAQLEARCLMMSTNNILSPANGEPVIGPRHEVVLGIYYLTRHKEEAKGDGMIFSNAEEVGIAYESKAVDLHAKIKLRVQDVTLGNEGEVLSRKPRIVDTSVGRALFSQIIPEGLNYDLINRVIDRPTLVSILAEVHKLYKGKQTVIVTDRLNELGFEFATQSGISIALDDLIVPSDKATLIQKAQSEITAVKEQYASGFLTEPEQRNRVIDIWNGTNDSVANAMMKSISQEEIVGKDGKARVQPSFNSVYLMADSGARGSAAQMRQLAGMRGLMAKPNGEVIETAITANFKEGLDVQQYYTSTHGARKGLSDTALKTANSGYLTRRLVDVAQDVVVVEQDCGTREGVLIRPQIEGGEVVVTLSDRILGRVLSEDIYVQNSSDEVLLKKGTFIEDSEVALIEENRSDQVKVRSVITCKTVRGVCSRCYGRDLSRGLMVNEGEAVGVIAAQSIGEPGTQLTMRTFHIGGAASREVVASNIRMKTKGSVAFMNMKTIEHHTNKGLVVTSRSGEIAVMDASGRQCERHKVPYGSTLLVKDGADVDVGSVIAEWDPHMHPIIAESSGVIRLVDFIEGITIDHQSDELTGLTSKVVLGSAQRTEGTKEKKPMLQVMNENGEPVLISGTKMPMQYFLREDTIVQLEEGDKIGVGDVIARVPQEQMKTRDITGGLPRVADLFEARTPKDTALLAEKAGVVTFGRETKDKRRLIITSEDGSVYEELVPKWRVFTVFEGEQVERGEVLIDGATSPQDLLRLKGVAALTDYILSEVQQVYRLQGVRINDKHIEVIVRQMLRKVKVTASGETSLIRGEHVDREIFLEENEKLDAKLEEAAQMEPVLMGITRASLSARSFLSAASFQETTRVLTEASLRGKPDKMLGLKENVLIGRLIPAGTGYTFHQKSGENDLFASMVDTKELMASGEINALDAEEESDEKLFGSIAGMAPIIDVEIENSKKAENSEPESDLAKVKHVVSDASGQNDLDSCSELDVDSSDDELSDSSESGFIDDEGLDDD
jgi:DNA-directed RNA polymerase subunit beta'